MSITKEFHRLLKRVGRISDGQASIENIDWEDGSLNKFNVVVIPNSGLYKAGIFEFEVSICSSDVRDIVCLTDIYHPNIDTSENSSSGSNVCLNILDFDHYSSYGMEGLIHGLIFLLKYPNLSDPLSPFFDGSDDAETYAENVAKYMRDEEIDDTTFDKTFRVIDGVRIPKDDSVGAAVKIGGAECEGKNTTVEGTENAENENTNCTDFAMAEGGSNTGNIDSFRKFKVNEDDIPDKYKDLFPNCSKDDVDLKLKRSMSCTDIENICFNPNLINATSKSLSSLNERTNDDNEDEGYKANTGHEFVEIEGEVFLIYRDFNEPFSIEIDIQTEQDSPTSDQSKDVDNAGLEIQSEAVEGAKSPDEEVGGAQGCSHLNADCITGTETGFETCVDTGRVFTGACNLNTDQTKCNNFLMFRTVLFKLASLFVCTMKHKKLKV